ncbi:unnamed protein product [Spirodela intermedia]|uniref:Uncharacterized protein n=1 Tax=Spirodela intermedia TaxID=51605 RepID=A0A7I8JP83_SPIIN|nr:unnamed protein product [Spirodela intermedia]CAA6672007.1 unnamed protein product [Spirodela intermedia]
MLAPDEHESSRNRVPPSDSYIRSFILKSAQQEKALHHICNNALRIVLTKFSLMISDSCCLILPW